MHMISRKKRIPPVQRMQTLPKRHSTYRQPQYAEVPKVVDEYLVEELLAAAETNKSQAGRGAAGRDHDHVEGLSADLSLVVFSRYSLV